MKTTDDYIPIELWHEAKDFIQSITDDVDIFNKFKCFDNMKFEEEALKFVAWWDLKSYLQHPHALILIYENIGNIEIEIGKYDLMDGFNQLQKKLVLLYELLKNNGMINE